MREQKDCYDRLPHTTTAWVHKTEEVPLQNSDESNNKYNLATENDDDSSLGVDWKDAKNPLKKFLILRNLTLELIACHTIVSSK